MKLVSEVAAGWTGVSLVLAMGWHAFMRGIKGDPDWDEARQESSREYEHAA